MTASGEGVPPAGAIAGNGESDATGTRTRLWVAAGFVALVAAGVLSGIALDRMVLMRGGARGGPGERGFAPPYAGSMGGGRGGMGRSWGSGGPPDSVRRRMRDGFAKEFG